MGWIKEINKIADHQHIDVDERAYTAIETNKAIYSGYYDKWHYLTEYTSKGEETNRNMKSLGMGKIVAEKMARLIFNEKAVINISDKKAEKFVKETLYENGFYKNFQRYLEYGYALGGMAIKVYEHEGKIKFSYAAADAFYPVSHDSETIDEALFINEEYKDGKYYTLMEWNEWKDGIYTITNELYESEQKGTIGDQVPLDTLYEDLDDVTQLLKVRRPVFVYFKLNTANNKNLLSPLGVSIYENSYDTLYMLDYLYDFFWNEFRLGKRRIVVPKSMLRPFKDAYGGEQVAFDPDETVFTALGMEDGDAVKDLSVEIRATDIIQSINALLDMLAMQTGLSAGTFTFDGKSMKTATEVVSENSMTYQTKNSHETLVEQGIQELITSMIDIAVTYHLYSGPLEFEVGIDFDDSIAQDRDKNLNYYGRAYQMNLMPRREAIMRAHNVDEETATQWILEMQEEKRLSEQSQMNGLLADKIGLDVYDPK